MTKYFILKGYNFTNLSDSLTEILIKLMQMILEDTKLYKKPL